MDYENEKPYIVSRAQTHNLKLMDWNEHTKRHFQKLEAEKYKSEKDKLFELNKKKQENIIIEEKTIREKELSEEENYALLNRLERNSSILKSQEHWRR